MSQIISSSLLLPHELKNRGTKRSILNILKIALDKFIWNGKKYHAQVDMVDSAGKKSLALGIECTSEPYTQYEFLGLAKRLFEAKI